MDGTPSLISELKKKVSGITPRTSAIDPLSPTDQHRSQTVPIRPSFQPRLEEHKETKVFANYIAENAKQQSRYSLLKSCFLGEKELMSAGLQEKQVNVESPIPFYSWEYVLVFDNPDFSKRKLKGITSEAAENHFATCFQGEAGALGYQQDINRQFERKAFLEAFSELPESDYIEPKWESIHFTKPQPRKAMNKGGMLAFTEEGLWTTKNSTPRDYMTLIRNVIQTKLALHVGLKTKLLLSASGEYIYMLLLADELDLQNEAERVGYHLQIQLGASDLDSMEPCDTNLRPLSELKSEGFDTALKDIQRVEMHLYSEIKGLLVEKTEECTHHIDIKLDSEGVTPEQWSTFREYLEIVKSELWKLKEAQVPIHVRFKRHQEILETAYQRVNTAHPKAPLLSLWDRLNIPTPLSAYSRYVRDVELETGKDILEREH